MTNKTNKTNKTDQFAAAVAAAVAAIADAKTAAAARRAAVENLRDLAAGSMDAADSVAAALATLSSKLRRQISRMVFNSAIKALSDSTDEAVTTVSESGAAITLQHAEAIKILEERAANSASGKAAARIAALEELLKASGVTVPAAATA